MAKGHNLNQLGRGLLGNATYLIARLFRQEFFHVPYTNLCKTVTLGLGPCMAQGHNLNKLGKGLLGNATYLISRLFRQENFFMLPTQIYVKL